jgi:hypothetical protein
LLRREEAKTPEAREKERVIFFNNFATCQNIIGTEKVSRVNEKKH